LKREVYKKEVTTSCTPAITNCLSKSHHKNLDSKCISNILKIIFHKSLSENLIFVKLGPENKTLFSNWVCTKKLWGVQEEIVGVQKIKSKERTCTLWCCFGGFLLVSESFWC